MFNFLLGEEATDVHRKVLVRPKGCVFSYDLNMTNSFIISSSSFDALPPFHSP
jgi:hypothetical protein